MRKILILLILCFSNTITKSQTNLVANPSFEDTISIHNPTSFYIQSYTTNWYGRNAYYSAYLPSSAAPVYQSNSFSVPSNNAGYQYAHSGVAYAGVHTYVLNSNPLRSYIQTKLTQTLEVGKKYKVEFYASLGDSLHTSNNTIGAYFSTDSFYVGALTIINQVPQIKNNEQNDLSSKTEWTLVCDTFVANGTERYMTIGNFITDSLSDTLYLGGGCYGPNSFILCEAFYYIDDVSVTLVDDSGIEERKKDNLSLFPNPNGGIFKLQYKGIINKPLILNITDVYGNFIDKIEITKTITDYENTSLPNGLYFYTLTQGEEETARGKIMIIK